MEKTKKIYITKFEKHYNTYLDILLAYRSNNEWFFDKEKSEIHTIPFVLTVASALECSLNDYIIEYYYKNYKEDMAKILISGLLSMTVKGKLQNIVPLLTANKYIINTNHKTYHVLVELIKMRNNLVHNKSGFTRHKFDIKIDIDNEVYLDGDLELLEKDNIDYSFGIRKNIGDYHDALEELHELFFSIYEEENFCDNELIIKLEKLKNHSIQII